MKQKYYKLPVRLEKLFEGDIRQLERCSELESIPAVSVTNYTWDLYQTNNQAVEI